MLIVVIVIAIIGTLPVIIRKRAVGKITIIKGYIAEGRA